MKRLVITRASSNSKFSPMRWLYTTFLSVFSPHHVVDHELLVSIETAIFQMLSLFRARATGSLPLTIVR